MNSANSECGNQRDQLASDLATCGQIIRDGSKSFHAASLLLPREVRAAAYALYAFCRVSDDAVDNGSDPVAALHDIRRRLRRAASGQPDPTSVDRAFAWVLKAYGIPVSIPEALIEGFEWDSEGRRFETLEDLKSYAARVAATVGVMMTLVMGVRSREALSRACDLGLAMQLTNIARDIGEDARAGRCYLPTTWLREAGLSAEDLATLSEADDRVRLLTARMLDAAQPLYAAGINGIAFLPEGCRPAIRAAAAIYSEIGAQIARAGHDTIGQRAVVSKRRKIALAAGSFIPARPTQADPAAPPAKACAFLIDAVESVAPPPAPFPEPPKAGTAPWAIDLFLRLEQRALYPGNG
ncbi:phytoene/squalene synthase family protein [Hyphomonas sp.]|uniref:phytoene/squalene synthase family protein n=1 Tax=Hyphomonas sp. TaxID=87 RepID=UPI0025C5BCF0|nr:phytoene/squalene synthase family protein [Hyphomonas sp.]MBI1400625.1 phytoene/squalene synthase family protein [Hyphomonas sp.]